MTDEYEDMVKRFEAKWKADEHITTMPELTHDDWKSICQSFYVSGAIDSLDVVNKKIVPAKKSDNGKRHNECGICHATKDLVGPFCGGPSAYYCKKCLDVIHKYTELQMEHHKRFVKITEARL